jgi:hypothetical protein
MTSQEMIQIGLADLASDEDSELIGEPRSVPHGGIAIDSRTYERRTFSIRCFQYYGTEETLNNALEILKDHNVDFFPDSDYVASMSNNVFGRKLSTIAGAKVFPMEDSCMELLAAIEKRNPKLGYHGNYVFMNSNGLFQLGFCDHGLNC